jgi:very-short-patch-repair endonuclease
MMRTPIQTARLLRQRMTAEEKLLWRNLRGHRLAGYKFRRQHPIIYQKFEKVTGFYAADFYCASKKTIIELDGKIHEFEDQKEYDKARDKLISEFGIRILRIKNDELKKLSDVLTKIELFLSNDLKKR